MKQNITPEQLNELSDEGLKKFYKWLKMPEGMTGHQTEISRLCNIGQMIEFLDEKYDFVYYFTSASNNKWIVQADPDDELSDPQPLIEAANTELCDALWEAVKEVLK